MNIDDLRVLEESAKTCKACKLSEYRKQVVFGGGPRTAEIFFIGEAPGEKEDITGRPFVGQSGDILDKLFSYVSFDRTDVYITSICKCRPPENRNPHKTEINACRPFLAEQLRIIKPKIIICLGRIAAREFIAKDFKVTLEHGQWTEKDETHVMGTFHPSAILRNINNMPYSIQDFRSIDKKLKTL